jgi:hypothetical protein
MAVRTEPENPEIRVENFGCCPSLMRPPEVKETQEKIGLENISRKMSAGASR